MGGPLGSGSAASSSSMNGDPLRKQGGSGMNNGGGSSSSSGGSKGVTNPSTNLFGNNGKWSKYRDICYYKMIILICKTYINISY